mgnify:CR=1 FL=1
MTLRQVAEVDRQQLEGVDELVRGSLLQEGLRDQDVLAKFVVTFQLPLPVVTDGGILPSPSSAIFPGEVQHETP